MRDDWKIIQTVVARHEATDHGGTRCTCPQVHRAIRAAHAFERQFGSRTKPGILPDKFNDKTGRWTTKTWMDSDSTLADADDFARLPKDKQQEKLRWLNAELEHGQAVLAEQMPGAPKRRSPRARKAEVIDDILKGAVPIGDGTFTFARSVNEAIGKDEATVEDVESFAVKKLEEDRQKQKRVEMGL